MRDKRVKPRRGKPRLPVLVCIEHWIGLYDRIGDSIIKSHSPAAGEASCPADSLIDACAFFTVDSQSQVDEAPPFLETRNSQSTCAISRAGVERCGSQTRRAPMHDPLRINILVNRLVSIICGSGIIERAAGNNACRRDSRVGHESHLGGILAVDVVWRPT